MNRAQSHKHSSQNSGYENLARGLGVFSIILGSVELLASHRLAKKTGLFGQDALIRSYGVREIVTGIGLLTAQDPKPWMLARVAGDALDLATLSTAISNTPHSNKGSIAFGVVSAITALDVWCANALNNQSMSKTDVYHDYSARSGFQNPQKARGLAKDFVAPKDFRIPELLRPYAV